MIREQIYSAVLDAMQAAEEIGGPEGQEYLALMTDIRRECQRRSEAYRDMHVKVGTTENDSTGCGCRRGSTCTVSHDPATCPCEQCRAATDVDASRVRCRAKVIRRSGPRYQRTDPHPLGYLMLTGPHRDRVFIVDPNDLDHVAPGDEVEVVYTPADQFARRAAS